MKKEYSKPLVTVITLIADRPIANRDFEDYVSNNDLIFDADSDIFN